MLLIKSLFGSKKFLAMLTGIIGIVALKVFKINLDATTVGEIVGLVAVYIGGQSVADAGKEAAKVEAVARVQTLQAKSPAEKISEIKSV